MSEETKEDSKPLNDTPSNEGVVDKGDVITSTNFQCVKSIQESSASLLRMVSKVDFHDSISNIISLYFNYYIKGGSFRWALQMSDSWN